VWVAFGLAWYSVDAAVHLLPLTVLAMAVAFRLAGRFATNGHPRTVEALAGLATGFVPPTLLWVIPVLGRLGVDGFARDVLLLGSPAAALYYLPHPPPEFYALATVAAALGLAVAGRAIRREWISPTVPLLVAATAGIVLAFRVGSNALMPEAWTSSLTFQLENAGYWLAPLAHWGGIGLLLRAGTQRVRGVGDFTGYALVPMATAMYLQLYPRTDGFHLVIAVPLTLVLATVLLGRVLRWWTTAPRLAGLPSRPFVGAVLAAVAALVLVARFGPALAGWWQSRMQGELLVDSPTVATRVGSDVADDLTAFGLATDFLTRHTIPGEPVLAFPALAGILYAARLTSPVPHDYWYPGRPDHADEAAMVATLRAAPPRFIATLNDGWTFFIGSPAYFLTARAFAVEGYVLVARFGRFDVLARRDVAATITPERFQPTGPGAPVLEPDLGRRRQAVKRWMAGLTGAEATHARLEDDPRMAILRLRAIRDGADIRTAGWLLAGYEHPHPRVRNEALGAMQLVTEGFVAARHRWADDLDLAAFRRYVEPYFARVEALRSAPDVRARDFAAAVLSLADAGGSERQ
jgi:hypothetical protein